MEKDSPFIHLIRTPYGYYFFDVNTNRIYKTEKNIYSALERLRDGGEPSQGSELSAIREMREKGLLKTNRPKTIRHPLTDKMDYYLNKKVQGISLQVTQDCNFRCSYCPYSQDDHSPARKHAKKSMSFETAKKGIDFVHKRSRDSEHIHISFYGGEPLLEFALIKKIVAYARTLFSGKPLSFNMTTNCSLLNADMLDFLNDNDILITISLDGPKEIHDGNRRFAVNGCGTFDVIIKKLKLIEEKYPEYLKRRVTFNAVLDPSKDFNCVNQMFVDYDVLKESAVRASLIDDTFNSEKNVYSPVFEMQQRYDFFKVFACQTGKIRKENLSKLTQGAAGEMETFKKGLGTRKIYDEMSHGGPCIIGAMRLFMDVDGRFFPCEKVSETNPAMNIGNADEGFDVRKIKALLNIARLTEKECKNCWAINFCCICPREIEGEEGLSYQKKLEACGNSKSYVENKIRTYLAINEIKAGGNL